MVYTMSIRCLYDVNMMFTIRFGDQILVHVISYHMIHMVHKIFLPNELEIFLQCSIIQGRIRFRILQKRFYQPSEMTGDEIIIIYK